MKAPDITPLRDGEVILDEFTQPKNRQQRRAERHEHAREGLPAAQKPVVGGFRPQPIITRKSFTTRKV